ncbi:MAG: hypothetical protein M5R38_06725 [Candidatus Methylomirabilis sp.]|nr:hypothetical protein [Candidatus Methylomirabilis sp.]
MKGFLVGDAGMIGQQMDGLRALGAYEQAGELAEALSIDRVFIAIPWRPMGEWRQSFVLWRTERPPSTWYRISISM